MLSLSKHLSRFVELRWRTPHPQPLSKNGEGSPTKRASNFDKLTVAFF